MSLIPFGNGNSSYHNRKQASKPRTRRRGNEAIDMLARRFGYFPRTFVWRGHEFHVEAVERCWTTGTRRNGGRMQRHYFQVRCAEGRFDLFQDLTHNTWHIAHS